MGSATMPPRAFHHEAMFYSDDAAYVDEVMSFVAAGLDAEEPVLVAVPNCRLDLLERHLDAGKSSLLHLASMEEIGRNPAWIIPAWADFLAANAADGRPVRGVGEPIWAARTAEELVECTRHEALLNAAFADAEGFTLLCPYDTSSLDASVLAQAEHTHPHLSRGGRSGLSDHYCDEPPPVSDVPLSPVPADAEVIEFGDEARHALRVRVAAAATVAGLPAARVGDAVLVVDEAATNSVCHGGGGGTIALWSGDRGLTCEVRDHGHISDPLAGRVRPTVAQPDGRGLWLIHQLCDLVQLRASAEGQVLRLHLSA
jgi:anti-sigma regulatory factor (Ser/Thr protein kinase)